jgi:HEAT repeat protein
VSRHGIILWMKPAQEVVEDALREEWDSDQRWEHIRALHGRNDEDAFQTAAALLESDDPERREIGADILAQLGAGKAERPFVGPATDLLLARIAVETHAAVLESIACAFGHLHDPRFVPVLYGLRRHPSEDVRYGVVFGLLGHDDDLAVEALVELSADPDEDVRDWATFGLGAQIERDDPQVREALAARLDDPHDDTRSEAIAGLSVRGDARAISPLLRELDGRAELEDLGHVEGESLLDLALHTRDERLCRLVEALASAWLAQKPGERMPEELEAALAACRA